MFISHPQDYKSIFTLIQAIANSLDFGVTHPFHNGLFVPIIEWVATERDLLTKIEGEVVRLEGDELDRIWEIVTKDFTNYRKGLRSAYFKVVTQTYEYASIILP